MKVGQTCSLPPADQDQNQPSCQVLFLDFINNGSKEKRKGCHFTQESLLNPSHSKWRTSWRAESSNMMLRGLCIGCLFHLYLARRPWRFSWQRFRPLLSRTTGTGFLILQNRGAQKCSEILRYGWKVVGIIFLQVYLQIQLVVLSVWLVWQKQH